MKLRMTMLAGCAICALATAAQADCAEDLARLTGNPSTAGDSAGISKDGSLAPLETPDHAETSAEAGTGFVRRARVQSGQDV